MDSLSDEARKVYTGVQVQGRFGGPGLLPANGGRTVWPLVAIGQKGSAVCDPRGFPVPLGIATNE
ncbi:MAG: hypothetical protein CR994_03990 [Maribacter sp.]|nr:MAG: hypothetical protein CR994_03990 [Maribacter sp.]